MHGFTVQSSTELPEYHGTGTLLRHEQSGAQVYHLHNDDPENMFSFAFLTPPPDSTGVAHILEHTVLSGSRNYPLKDPFLHLMKGSMNTFLNALTFPDKTVYPASSPVARDLFNIMEVYGDAVFFPLLKRELFQQEGHRLQFMADGTLERTGVVLNEMKGARSTHDAVAGDWAIRSLLPDTPYGYDSGGDPAEIPHLTYEEFVEFHRRYYHPSNCRIFLYGNIATERYLELLDERFLSHFHTQERPAPIPEQPRWESPRELERTFPLDASEDDVGQSSVTLNWLLFPVTDPVRLKALEVLGEVLLGHSGSPLQKLISESNLGEDLSSPSGIETDLREAIFAVGMRGTDPEKKGAIIDLIEGELRRLVDEGLDDELVTGAIRTVEFRNREIRSGPTGIRLAGRLYRGWLHDAPPETTLEFRRPFDALKQELEENPNYFESMITDHLLNNPHRSTLVVRPDKEQLERERREAERDLAAVSAALPEDEGVRISEEQRALEELQAQPDRPEDIERLPTLTKEDAPREVPRIPVERMRTSDGVEVLRHGVFTNGVVYVDLAFSLDGISEELLPYIPLFTTAVTETGLSDTSYDAISNEIALKMGGLNVSAEVSRIKASGDRAKGGPPADTPHAYLHVRMKCLRESLDEALELMLRILTDANFGNSERLATLVQETRNDYRAAIIPGGHNFAALRAARGVSGTARVEDSWRGLSQYFFLRNLADGSGEDAEAARADAPGEAVSPPGGGMDPGGEGGPGRGLDSLSDVFYALRDSFVVRSRLIAAVTCDPEAGPHVAERLEHALARLPMGAGLDEYRGLPVGRSEVPRHESLIVSSAVNYVAVALQGTAYGTAEYAAEAALAHILRTGRLWELIRMKGGAYGAFATTRGLEELFSFVSYRDPHVLPTIQAYGQAVDELVDSAPDERTVELAVISLIGREQRPLSPGEQNSYALRWHLLGLTPEMRQAHRDYTLGLGPEAVQQAARRIRERLEGAYVAVVGGRAAIESAAEAVPGFTEHVIEVPV